MITRLDKLIKTLESGSRPKGGVKNETIGIPSLGAEHLNSEGGFNFTKIKYILKDFFENQKTGIIKREDILVVKDGATTGKVSFVGEDFPYEQASINEHVFKITLNKNLVRPRYAYWHLYGPQGKKQILKDFRGATVGGISRSFTKNIEFHLPSLEDQKRIVKILDKADALRQKRKQAIKLLDSYLKSVFLDMFGDPIRNRKKWKIDKLNNICHRLSDGPFGSKLKSEHYVEKGVRVIRLQNIGVNEFKDNDKAHISESYYESDLRKFKCNPGDIVIATLGDPNIRACIVPDDIGQSINKADCVHCIPDKKTINPAYLLSLLNLPQFHHSFHNLVHGETRARVNSGQLKNVEIPLPKMELQNKFAEIVQRSDSIKQEMLTQLEELENQFQALMQKAFKGEL